MHDNVPSLIQQVFDHSSIKITEIPSDELKGTQSQSAWYVLDEMTGQDWFVKVVSQKKWGTINTHNTHEWTLKKVHDQWLKKDNIELVLPVRGGLFQFNQIEEQLYLLVYPFIKAPSLRDLLEDYVHETYEKKPCNSSQCIVKNKSRLTRAFTHYGYAAAAVYFGPVDQVGPLYDKLDREVYIRTDDRNLHNVMYRESSRGVGKVYYVDLNTTNINSNLDLTFHAYLDTGYFGGDSLQLQLADILRHILSASKDAGCNDQCIKTISESFTSGFTSYFSASDQRDKPEKLLKFCFDVARKVLSDSQGG
ncbi:MAG: hypothetical protein ACR2PT_21550 [Endozoicomonas sp.]